MKQRHFMVALDMLDDGREAYTEADFVPAVELSLEGERNLGAEILDGINEIKQFKKGELALRTHELSEPSPPKVIRLKLNMSQSAFAGLMGVSVRPLQDWEQGRREPQGPAVALLRIAEQHPEVFEQLH